MQKIKKYLKEKLTKDRYQHTIGVANISAALAMRYNPDTNNDDFMKKAYLAGMLHDCAKCMDHDKKIKICKENQLPMSEFEENHPYLLHGKVGAFIASSKFDIHDEDILNAVTWHTTGRPGMSLLEKIVYIADFIEPNRKPFPDLDTIRKLAFIDIDECMKSILSHTLLYLQDAGNAIDDMTKKTYESYL